MCSRVVALSFMTQPPPQVSPQPLPQLQPQASPLAPPPPLHTWVQLLSREAVWHDRGSRIWGSTSGAIHTQAHDKGASSSKPAGSNGTGHDATASAGTDHDATAMGGATATDMDHDATAMDGATAMGGATATVMEDDGLPTCLPPPHQPQPGTPRTRPHPLWQPFLSFLRVRASKASRLLLQVARARRQPVEPAAILVSQLRAYLPTDPAVLLGLPLGWAAAALDPGAAAFDPGACASGGGAEVEVGAGCACGRAVAAQEAEEESGAAALLLQPILPVLLHGDIHGRNVLCSGHEQNTHHHSRSTWEQGGGSCVGEGQVERDTGACTSLPLGITPSPSLADPPLPLAAPHLELIDFADCGFGDPLYDLMPVLFSCLSLDAPACAEFWSAYRARVDVASLWPSRGGLPLSYCAMCYSLMHEEGGMEKLLQGEGWGKGGGGPGGGGGAGQVGGAGAESGGHEGPVNLSDLASRRFGFLDAEP